MVTIPYSEINMEKVLLRGADNQAASKLETESGKRDNLRGGNSGCISDTGDIYGCHRAAIARSLGLEVRADYQSELFFLAGNAIEAELMFQMRAGHEGVVLAEEEVPVTWNLDSGRKVTGRPDFMLLSEEGSEKQLGVELKTIVSTNSAHRVFFDKKPDPKHVIQAAHYMWQHDCPWVLTYISPCRYEVNYFTRKKLGLGFKDKLNPFRAHFYLTYRDDVLYYKHASEGEEIKTIVTPQGIKDFYTLVEECIEKRTLGYTPASKYIDGSDMPYQHEKYCTYCKAADQVNGDFDAWCDLLSTGGVV